MTENTFLAGSDAAFHDCHSNSNESMANGTIILKKIGNQFIYIVVFFGLETRDST